MRRNKWRRGSEVGAAIRLPFESVLTRAWWRVRGVRCAEDFRTLCRRCGTTGQAHWSFGHCWRFAPMIAAPSTLRNQERSNA